MKKPSLAAKTSRFFLTGLFFLMGVFNNFMQPAFAAAASSGNTYVVNSTLDTPNADPASGLCADAQGRCTLRAAIMLADFNQQADTIILPAGTYQLTRPGYDNSALVGDLDISGDLTIQGAGSGVTILDGNGAITHDRVFKILSTVKNAAINGITILNGQSISSTAGTIGGGGLYMEGSGHLSLSDVILQGNTALNGGGIYANFSSQGGSLDMEHVVLRNNQVSAGGVGAGGGLFASLLSSSSEISLLDSQVISNTADGTGGGLFVSGTDLAHWTIQRSEIDFNSGASGGGIGNFTPLTMTDSRLHGNHAAFDGGAIEAFSPLSISRSTLDANSANRYGGGIFDLATGSSALYHNFANIDQSTLSSNYAKDGGGIYHDGYITHYSRLTLTNSTLSGNAVSADGGGLFLYSGQAQLFNSTIAFNRVQLNFPRPGPGIGAGLYITATSEITALNTIVADDRRGTNITPGVEDDCYSYGNTGELGFNLILTTTNCYVTGAQVGDIVGQDPHLGPLEYNGGPTQTRALLPGSPAIDAGATAGCSDTAGNPITIDQRGYPRPIGPSCDIGAFEYNPNASTLFLPMTQR